MTIAESFCRADEHLSALLRSAGRLSLIAMPDHVRLRHLCAHVMQVQAVVRGAAVRRSFLQQRAAAICVQAHWRGMHARQLYQRLIAAVAIQRYSKCFCLLADETLSCKQSQSFIAL